MTELVTYALLVLVVLVLSAMLLSWTAGRLDRLHHRVEKAGAVLDSALLRRSAAAAELAAAEVLDPAESLLLLEAAHAARTAPGDEREPHESRLSQSLVAVLSDPDEVAELRRSTQVAELLDELGLACRSVELSRRFHNDLVASARGLRQRRLVRWFRLAGRSRPPRTVDLDDSWPPTLR